MAPTARTDRPVVSRGGGAQLVGGRDDGRRAHAVQGIGQARAPRDGDGVHAGGLAREHVDDGVTDVDGGVGAAAHPLEREQQRRRVGLVALGVLHRDEHVDVLAEAEDVHRLLRRLAPLRRGDADVDAGRAQVAEHVDDARRSCG